MVADLAGVVSQVPVSGAHASTRAGVTIDVDASGAPRSNIQIGDDADCSKDCLQWRLHT